MQHVRVQRACTCTRRARAVKVRATHRILPGLHQHRRRFLPAAAADIRRQRPRPPRPAAPARPSGGGDVRVVPLHVHLERAAPRRRSQGTAMRPLLTVPPRPCQRPSRPSRGAVRAPRCSRVPEKHRGGLLCLTLTARAYSVRMSTTQQLEPNLRWPLPTRHAAGHRTCSGDQTKP